MDFTSPQTCPNAFSYFQNILRKLHPQMVMLLFYTQISKTYSAHLWCPLVPPTTREFVDQQSTKKKKKKQIHSTFLIVVLFQIRSFNPSTKTRANDLYVNFITQHGMNKKKRKKTTQVTLSKFRPYSFSFEPQFNN